MRFVPLSTQVTGIARAYTLVDDSDYDWLLNIGSWALDFKDHKDRLRPRASCKIDGCKQYMHRVILGLPRKSRLVVDHIDGDPLNNQRANLRSCTVAENNQNRAAQRFASSRFRGVRLTQRGKWNATVTLGGYERRLGLFSTEIEAALAVDVGRRQLMPFAQTDPALTDALQALPPVPRAVRCPVPPLPQDRAPTVAATLREPF